jgi:DNA-binding CsgD family transcriptional regulator
MDRHLAAARAAHLGAGTRPAAALVDVREAQFLDLLGIDGADAAFTRGRDALVPLGLEGLADRVVVRPPLAAAPANPGGLTRRELEVLAAVAGGAPSKEIATRLGVGLATVHRHLANVFLKLGVRNRTEAATWAIAHGIEGPPAQSSRGTG